jgi:O-antigen ligase
VAGRTLAAGMGAAPLLARLAWPLLAGGLASAACGLLQYKGWWSAFGGWISTPQPVAEYGVFGNLSQQNHFATYEALALTACAYLVLTGRLALRWAIACAVVLLAALALSGSRSMLLYLAWLLAAAFLLAPLTGRLLHLRRWLLIAVLVMLVAVIVLAFAARISPTALGPQLTRLVSPQDGAFGPRMFYWGHALRMFMAHPWLGVGFDGFALQLEAQLTTPSTSMRTICRCN